MGIPDPCRVFFFHFFLGGVVSARNHPAGGTFTLSSVGGSSLKGAEGADQKSAATQLEEAIYLNHWIKHLFSIDFEA